MRVAQFVVIRQGDRLQSDSLQPITLANNYDLSHAHTAFVKMYDGGKMDGADLVGLGCQAGAVGCPPPNPQFMYVNPSEVAPYFQLAETYTFGDRMFQTNQGPSFPAHPIHYFRHFRADGDEQSVCVG